MKSIFSITPLLIFLGCSQQAQHEKASVLEIASMSTAQPEVQLAEPFAIVELFTSEGCSDCPSAEKVLNEITHKAMADKSYVYPLAFHVDYWNKLGWRDVFSDSAFSNRQRKYRKALGARVVYTPQMIVNGKQEFVGSNAEKANAAIRSALKETPKVYFSMEPNSTWSELHYDMISAPKEVSENADDYLFCIALVERGLVTKVSRGENKNRTLEHENVVRQFRRIPFVAAGAKVALPALANGVAPNEKHSIVAFVQHRKTMEIIGANLWNY